MVSSPRDQGSLALLWPVIGLGSVAYMFSLLFFTPSPDVVSRLLLFYQPFVPPLVMLWCWAFAVRHWERSGARYANCFSTEDARKLVGYRAIIRMATVLSFLLSLSTALLRNALVHGHDARAYWQARLAYMGVILFPFIPGTWLYEVRKQRVLGGGDHGSRLCILFLWPHWEAPCSDSIHIYAALLNCASTC